MAAWQIPFALVPRIAWQAASQRPTRPILTGTASLWIGHSAADWGRRLKSTLGQSASHWDPTGLMWGNYDSHCLELATGDDGEIDLLRFRFDRGSNDTRLLDLVLAFAREHDLLLLTSNGSPIEPERRYVGDEASRDQRTKVAGV